MFNFMLCCSDTNSKTSDQEEKFDNKQNENSARQVPGRKDAKGHRSMEPDYKRLAERGTATQKGFRPQQEESRLCAKVVRTLIHADSKGKPVQEPDTALLHPQKSFKGEQDSKVDDGSTHKLYYRIKPKA